jgi:hypothetical protein
MRFFLKILVLVLIAVNVLFYSITIKEGQQVLGKKTSLISNVLQSFEYYVKWILPYWWLIIILASLLLTGLMWRVKKLYGRGRYPSHCFCAIIF